MRKAVAKSLKAPSRADKKVIAGFFDRAVHKQLTLIAADRETKIQGLLGEALNLLFEKYGKRPIA